MRAASSIYFLLFALPFCFATSTGIVCAAVCYLATCGIVFDITVFHLAAYESAVAGFCNHAAEFNGVILRGVSVPINMAYMVRLGAFGSSPEILNEEQSLVGAMLVPSLCMGCLFDDPDFNTKFAAVRRCTLTALRTA